MKQIKLVNLPKSELRMIEVRWWDLQLVAAVEEKADNVKQSEIDLLKNLLVGFERRRCLPHAQVPNQEQHDNIVKYIGFVKSVDCLNIILEYVVLNPCPCGSQTHTAQIL